MSSSTARHLVWGSIRVERSVVALLIGLLAVGSAMAVAALMIGDYPVGPLGAIRALVGQSTDGLATFFVRELRLPRVLAALLVGAALGASGAIVQQLSRNPLGSPDIVGFTTGSATGALVAITLLGGGADAAGAGALVGGLVTALVVGSLAWQRGSGVTGLRLVLVGIGVAAVLQGVNALLVVRADLSAAQQAAQWLAGSLNATTWTDVTRLLVVAAVVVPVTAWAARDLPVLGLGDDVARAVGVRVEVVRLVLITCAVVLVAAATAVAGPIAFIALAAPQLARRLNHSAGGSVGSAAAMGAVLVLTSDVIAQRLFAPTQLPVGVVSGSLGGLYLIWLLTRERR